MSLTQDDREWMIKIIKELLDGHAKSCPYGITLGKSKAFLCGIFVCILMISGGLGLGISKVISLLSAAP